MITVDAWIAELQAKITRLKNKTMIQEIENTITLLNNNISPITGGSMECDTEGCGNKDIEGMGSCNTCYQSVMDKMNNLPISDEEKLDWLERGAKDSIPAQLSPGEFIVKAPKMSWPNLLKLEMLPKDKKLREHLDIVRINFKTVVIPGRLL